MYISQLNRYYGFTNHRPSTNARPSYSNIYFSKIESNMRKLKIVAFRSTLMK